MNQDQPCMTFVPKKWGWERWIVNKEEYGGKLLYIAKNRSCSLHYHESKDETLYVQSGKVRIYYSDDVDKVKDLVGSYIDSGKDPKNFTSWVVDFLDNVVLEPQDNFYIPKCRVHQIKASRDTELFEFSAQHFEEDNIRLIDND